jgi:anti-sigma-K factor RskA
VSELNEMGCAGFADVAAELALGALTGRERAEALEHLDRCPACQEHVRQLTVTGQELLWLLPPEEPPPGFETRVLERLGLAAPRPRPSGRGRRFGRGRPFGRGRRLGRGRGDGRLGVGRRTLAAVAVVVAVAVSALGGWRLGAAGTSPAGSSLSSAALLSASRQTVGSIFFYGADRQALFVSVDFPSGTGTVICQLVSQGGDVVTLGSFSLDTGYGAWGSSDLGSHGQFTQARLVSQKGAILATASFPPR